MSRSLSDGVDVDIGVRTIELLPSTSGWTTDRGALLAGLGHHNDPPPSRALPQITAAADGHNPIR